MQLPNNRNSAGKGNIALYVVGFVSLTVGGHLSAIVRINLLTGQTSHPYLGSGIALVLTGLLLVAVASWAAKRNLSR